MIQELRNLNESLNSKLRTRKALVYTINTRRFQALFEEATEVDQCQVFIRKEDLVNVKLWSEAQSGDFSLTNLRSMARRYAVKNYARLPKRELLRALHPYI
jgi:hypothetical protein